MKVGDMVYITAVGQSLIPRRGPFIITATLGDFIILGMDFPENQVFRAEHLEVAVESR